MDEKPKIILFDGQPGDGKSTLCAYLLYRTAHLDSYGFILSTTLYNDPIWGALPWLNKIEIIDDVAGPLKKILEAQKSVIKREKKKIRLALVLDDLIGKTKFGDKDSISLLATSRHDCVHIFITSQYTRAIIPMLRGIATEVYMSKPSDEGMEKQFVAYFRFLSKHQRELLIYDLIKAGQYVFCHFNRLEGNVYRLVKVPEKWIVEKEVFCQ